MIVIDASSLAKYILREDNWIEVRKKLGEGVVSVDHVVKEVSNAIWKKVKVLKIEDVNIAISRYYVLKKLIEGDVIRLESELKYLDKAFKIAIDHGISVYDALYIAQALDKNAKLLTSDKRQSQVAKNLGVETIVI